MKQNIGKVLTIADYALNKVIADSPGNITNSKIAILTLFLQDVYKIGGFEYIIDFDNEVIKVCVKPARGKIAKFRPKDPSVLDQFVKDGLGITFKVEFV